MVPFGAEGWMDLFGFGDANPSFVLSLDLAAAATAFAISASTISPIFGTPTGGAIWGTGEAVLLSLALSLAAFFAFKIF